MKKHRRIEEIEWEIARFTEMIIEIYRKIEHIETRLKKIEERE